MEKHEKAISDQAGQFPEEKLFFDVVFSFYAYQILSSELGAFYDAHIFQPFNQSPCGCPWKLNIFIEVRLKSLTIVFHQKLDRLFFFRHQILVYPKYSLSVYSPLFLFNLNNFRFLS